MKLMSLMSPMPFQSVNDSSTLAIAGPQTRPTTTSVGTATMSATISRSVPVSARTRCDRRGRCLRAAPASRTVTSATEDRFLLVLDLLGQAVDVVGVLEELLQRRDHHGRREVRPGVPVEELRDRLGVAHQFRALLLQRV